MNRAENRHPRRWHIVNVHTYSVHEGIISPQHTRGNSIYLPVASTSALSLIPRLNFLGSNDQKQSVGKRISKCSAPHFLSYPSGQEYDVSVTDAKLAFFFFFDKLETSLLSDKFDYSVFGNFKAHSA